MAEICGGTCLVSGRNLVAAASDWCLRHWNPNFTSTTTMKSGQKNFVVSTFCSAVMIRENADVGMG